MFNIVSWVAVAFSIAAVLVSLYCCTVVRDYIDIVNKHTEGLKDWSESLSNECNESLQSYYTMLLDACKKDVIAYFDEYKSSDDLSDVEQYIEDASVVIG